MARAVLRSTQYSSASAQRLVDAAKLCERQRWTGAIYLAGYGVECVMKAELAEQLRRIGGWLENEGHPLFKAMWTHDLPLIAGVLGHPTDLATDVRTIARTWRVEMRYESRMYARAEAESILVMAERISKTVNVRLLS